MGGVGWPHSFPDFNPFDYFVWGVSELRVNAKSHNKFKDLIQKMKEVMGPLARDTLAKASTSFRFFRQLGFVPILNAYITVCRLQPCRQPMVCDSRIRSNTYYITRNFFHENPDMITILLT